MQRDGVRRWGPWIASVLIAAGLLGYLLRGIDLQQLTVTARGMAPRPFVAFLAINLVGVAARACRFWVLLGRTVPLTLLLGITLVRNLFVDLIPARLGELSYVYLVRRRGGRTVEDALASLAVAVLLDVVALSPLLLLALLTAGGRATLSPAVAVGVSLSVAALGYMALQFGAPIVRTLAGQVDTGRVSTRQRLADRLRLFASSLDRARNAGVLGVAFVLSIIVRVCKYGSTYFLVVSILAGLGYASNELSVTPVFLTQLAAELAASLPVHGVAGFGTYEAAWSLALQQFGFPREHAVISGLLAHAFSQLLEYALGGVALLYLMRPGAGSPRTRVPA
jgi:uncharacterized membrane protein YbhN (UPF0104 family)